MANMMGDILDTLDLKPKVMVGNILDNIAPNTTSIVVSAAEGVRDLRTFLNRNRNNISVQSNQIERSPVVQESQRELDRVTDDIHDDMFSIQDELEVINDNFDEIMEEFPEFSAGDINTDPQAQVVDSNLRGAEATTRMTAAAATANISAMRKIAKLNAKGQMKSAEYLAKSQSNSSLIFMTKMNQQFMGVNKRLDVINSNIVKLVEVAGKSTLPVNKKTVQFMENMETMMEVVTKAYVPQENKNSQAGFNFLDFGYIDPKEVAGHVKGNLKNSILGVATTTAQMMKSMLFGDGTLFTGGTGLGGSARGQRDTGQFGQIIEGYVTMGIETALGKFLGIDSKNIRKLDKNLFRYMRQGMLSLGDRRSDNPLLGLLGDILGVKADKRTVGLGKYDKDAMSWNGVAQKYLTEVIPGYLANIEKGILGLDEARVYDQDKGRFFTESQLKAEFTKLRKKDMGSFDPAVRQLMEALDSDEGRSRFNEDQKNELLTNINSMLGERLRSNQSTDPDFANKLEEMLGGLFNPNQAKDFIMNLEDAIYDMRKNDTRRIRDIENSREGAAYRNLLNNGESYASLLGDMDIFDTNARVDRFGKIIRSNMTSEEDRRYRQSAYISQLLEGPAREFIGKIDATIPEKLRPWVETAAQSLNLPMLKLGSGRRSEFSNDWDGFSDIIQSTDYDLFDTIYRGGRDNNVTNRASRAGNAVRNRAGNVANRVSNRFGMDFTMGAGNEEELNDIRNQLLPSTSTTSSGQSGTTSNKPKSMIEIMATISDDVASILSILKKGSGNDDSSGGDGKPKRKRKRRRRKQGKSKLDRRGPGVDTGSNNDLTLEDIENMSESQQDQELRESDSAVDDLEDMGDYDNDPDSLTENLLNATQDQTRAIITSNRSLHRTLSVNLGKIFGKDGRLSKIFQSDTFTKLKKKVSKFLFGDKVDGSFKNGIFSTLGNKFLDVADYFKFAINGEEYTDRSGKKHTKTDNSVLGNLAKGYRSVFDNTMKHLMGDDYKENENYKKYLSWADGSKKKDKENRNTSNISRENIPSSGDGRDSTQVLSDATQTAANNIIEAGRNASEVLTGNRDSNDADVGKQQKSILEKIKAGAPKLLTAGAIGAAVPLLAGGSMGVLGGLFLPSMPLGGAVLGIGTMLASKTETFQKIMFGEKDDDGKRTGGLISKELTGKFKKLLPGIVGGATLGLLKGLVFGGGVGPLGLLTGSLLPGGLLGGALLGAATGIMGHSEKFKNILFGDRDANDDGKIKSKAANAINGITEGLKKSKNFVVGGAKGIAGGLLTGAVVSQMGVLGGALGIAGPVGFGLAGLGLGIASQTARFQQFMFGEDEIGPDGKPTGKKIKNGLIHKFTNFMQLSVFQPVASRAEEAMTDMAYWMRDKMIQPFKIALAPITNAGKDLKESISDAIHDAFSMVGEKVTDFTQAAIEKVFNWWPVKLLGAFIKTLGKGTLSLVKGGAKLAGSALMLPVNAFNAKTKAKRDVFKNEFMDALRNGEVEGYDASATGADMMAAKQKWAEANYADRNMSFLWDDEERAMNRDERKNAKAKFKQDRKENKIRNRFLRADGYNETANISYRTYQRRLKDLQEAGIDTSEMESVEDLRDFMFQRGKYSRETKGENTLQQQMQREEARDTRDENYQREVVSLLRDQLQVQTGGQYDDLSNNRPGTLEDLNDRELDDLHTSESERSSILENSLTNSLNALADRRDARDEENARTEREANETAQARSRGGRRERDNEEGSILPVVSRGSSNNNDDDENKTSIWSKLGSFFTEHPEATMTALFASPLIAQLLGATVDDVVDVVGGIGKTVTTLAGKSVVSTGKVIAELGKNAIVGVGQWGANKIGDIKDRIFGGNEVQAIDEHGNLMYDEQGNPIMTEQAGNGGVLATGAEYLLKRVSGVAKTNFIEEGVKGLGRSAAGFVDNLAHHTFHPTDWIRSAGNGLWSGAKGAVKAALPTNLGRVVSDAATGGLTAGLRAGAAGIREGVNGFRTTNNALRTARAEELAAKGLQDTNSFAGLLDKAKGFLDSAVDKLANSKAAQKIFTDENFKALSEMFGKLIDTAKTVVSDSRFVKYFGKLSQALLEAGGRLIKHPYLVAGFAVWDFSSGALNAANIFHVDPDDVDGTMQICAGLIQAILGFGTILPILQVVVEIATVITGERLNPIGFLCTWLYKIMKSYDAEAISKLDAAQLEYNKNAEAWMEETGGTLAEYDAMMKESQNLWDKANMSVNNFSEWTGGLAKSLVEKTKSAGTYLNEKADTVASWGSSIGNTLNNLNPFKKKTSEGSGLGYGGVPQFSQRDPRWANMTIGTNGNSPYTMGAGGCGPTSLAMVARSMGRGVDPGTIGAMARDRGYAVAGGSSKELFTEGAHSLGLKSKQIGSSGIEDELRSGKPVILSGKAGEGSGTPYTPVGHIVTASGMDDKGNVIVNDPMKDAPTKYPLDKLKKGMKHGWSYSDESIGSGETYFDPTKATFFSQMNPQWKDYPFGSKTIGRIGCIMTSLAMALDSFAGGRGFTPDRATAQYGKLLNGNNFTWGSILPQAAKDFGLEYKKLTTKEEILKAAHEKKPVLLHGPQGSGSLFGGTANSNGGKHALLAIDGNTANGDLLIHDPASNSGANKIRNISGIKQVSDSSTKAFAFSKDGKGLDDFTPSDFTWQEGTSSYTGSSDSTGSSTGKSGSAASYLSPLSEALSKMGSIVSNDISKRLSEGSGDGDYLSGLTNALSSMANIAGADIFSQLSGISYQDAKAKMNEISGTGSPMDNNTTYDPNAPSNTSYTQYGEDVNNIINQPLNKYPKLTEEDMNGWFERINSTAKNKPIPYLGQGQMFLDVGKATGLDPRYIVAHSGLESGWGSSRIAREKGNYFGIGAYDSSPYKSAYEFEPGLKTGISGGAEWISEHYTQKGYDTLAKMKERGYATDPEWPVKIAQIMKKGPKGQETVTKEDIDPRANMWSMFNEFKDQAIYGNSSEGSGIGYGGTILGQSMKAPSDMNTNTIDQLTNKINVALDSDALVDKLDALLTVSREQLDVMKSQAKPSVNIGSGDTNININGKSSSKGKGNTIVVNNSKDNNRSNLRLMHDTIARSSMTSA